LLEAVVRDALGAAAERALEHALDLAEPEGLLLFFLLQPTPGLLERHARHRTAHPSLLAEILDLLGQVAGGRGHVQADEVSTRKQYAATTGPISNVTFSETADDAPATLDELLVHLILPHTGQKSARFWLECAQSQGASTGSAMGRSGFGRGVLNESR
jgi:hypothetical protein